MKQIVTDKCLQVFVLAGLLLFSACRSEYKLAGVEGSRVEITSAFDAAPDEDAVTILAPYKAKVDSIMKPVIGSSLVEMDVKRPESMLSNFAADVLKQATVPYIGKQADLAITNMGGLRNDLPKGEITYGDVYEIFPFENSLCILTISGKSLMDLFGQIAQLGGEGISGAQLVIGKDGTLISVKVGGKAVEPEKLYTLATLDYLAEGNDGMVAFLEATERQCPDGATVRGIVVDYIKSVAKKGGSVTSSVEGRILVK